MPRPFFLCIDLYELLYINKLNFIKESSFKIRNIPYNNLSPELWSCSLHLLVWKDSFMSGPLLNWKEDHQKQTKSTKDLSSKYFILNFFAYYITFSISLNKQIFFSFFLKKPSFTRNNKSSIHRSKYAVHFISHTQMSL